MAPFQHTKLDEAYFRRSPIGHFCQNILVIFKASAGQVPGNHVLGIEPILAIIVENIQEDISANLYSILIIGYRDH